MQPLIDADCLRYEVGYAAETGWQGEGLPPFDYAAHLLDERINNICAIVGATAPPLLFLSGKGNFRYEIAKRQPYKTRPSKKPYHYYNLTAYMRSKYDTIITQEMEADDALAIEQCRRATQRLETLELPETIICSKDKDLRTVPGWFYSWELGNHPSFGPVLIDETGYIKLSADGKKLSGIGGMFFYAQCLMGDPVDSIPGLPKTGPSKAFNILQATTTLPEAFKAVLEAYRAVYGPMAEEELLEQARLLWMTKELHPDGSVVLWELPVEAS